MFHAGPTGCTDRWASAFIHINGTDSEAELVRLKTIVSIIKSIAPNPSGKSNARHLEKLLRANIGAHYENGGVTECENTIRFITLLVSKQRFGYVDAVISRIEKSLDEINGILDVTTETAAAIDSTVEDRLKQLICTQTGAAGINMKTVVVPELIAGYRLHIGSLCIDASLRRQLEKMTEDLLQVRNSGAL